MKKIVAILLVLLVASVFVFAGTCSRCNTTYEGNCPCPYCTGSNYAYNNKSDTCFNRYSKNEANEALCHDGYWDAKNKMSGSTSASEE